MKEQNLNKYAYLDRLSTQQLEEILRADADSPGSGDDEAIFYILEVMKKRKRQDPSYDPSSDLDRCWNEFQTLYNTPEGTGQSLYPVDEQEIGSRPAVRRPRRLHRIVLAAAVLVLLVASLTVPVAGYTSILEMLGIWTTEQFAMQDAEAGPGGAAEDFDRAQNFEETVGDELRAVLAEYGITEKVVPRWMPEDFKLQGDVLVQEPSGLNAMQFFALYSGSGDFVSLTITEYVGNAENRICEKTAVSPEVYQAGEIEHYLFQNSDNLNQWSAVWYKGTLECVINTTLSESALKQVIDSIYYEE